MSRPGPSSVSGTTVYGEDHNDLSSVRNGKGNTDSKRKAFNGGGNESVLTEDNKTVQLSVDYSLIHRPFFCPINQGAGGLLESFKQLDTQLREAGRPTLMSAKKGWKVIGRTVEPGSAGLYSHAGLPKLILTPGRYPGFPFGNWVGRTWQGVTPLSTTVINYHGLIAVQVSQNQAAVISDPSNQIFIVRNGGFVALSIEGTYRLLGVVDQVNLKNVIVDPLAGGKETRILGHQEEVKMSANLGHARQEYVVATFLDIPANNCVILQKGDDLIQLPAGQHCITNPNITVRGWFSKGESQLELGTRDLYTKDQVPVELKIYVRWQLMDPLKLCCHGYETPYAALKDKTLSVLTQIVSHLEYSSMVKQRSFNPGDDAADGPDSGSQAFLDSLRTRAMDELHEAALEYGIELRDLAVIDRKFKGEIAKTMDALTTRSLQAQVEAANVERENSNRVKKEQGSLQVAKVLAIQRQTEADAAAYSIIAKARAEAEGVKIAAQAQAEAALIVAKAEAQAILSRNAADADVKDSHARLMQGARVEVQRIAAYGNKTVFVPTEGNVAQNVAAGFGLVTGSRSAQT